MDEAALLKELRYKAVRSGGAGGQHVNKVSSKVLLQFDLGNSQAFTEAEKQRLIEKLGSRLSGEQQLLLQADTARSQHKNKELVTKRFLALIKDGLKVPARRRKTAPSKGAVEKRLEGKKQRSEKKSTRRKPRADE